MDTSRTTVALVGGKGLGDNLIEMVLAENAYRQGCTTTVYSDIIWQLKDWFPQHQIYPSLPLQQFNNDLPAFSLFFWSGTLPTEIEAELQPAWVDYMAEVDDSKTMVENMTAVCDAVFPGAPVVRGNGICPPEDLRCRRFEKRICIHPTSAELSKNWLPERYITLAKQLQQLGYDPVFTLSLSEGIEWGRAQGDIIPYKSFATVADLAAFVYESGFFIGNDSGVGHLASCLGIPTLSIHGRKKKARLWQPGWGDVRVVTPPVNLIGNTLRQHYWKYLLSVRAVFNNFDQLTQSSGA